MAFLTINGEEYKAKVTFNFSRRADDLYKTTKKSKEGEYEVAGVESIYEDLLGYKVPALANFWDCAVHNKKDRPKIEDIEKAIEAEIEKGDEAIDQLFQDAFTALDQSGFFKRQLNEYWKNIKLSEKMAKDEKEKKQAKEYIKQMEDKRKELTA
ncbi:tail assembly chaperone [Halobacillus karajensis]|uniref:Phage protein n=1 Tax=Halobacillus karajensis TaxID=195088 RepID=A0A059NUX7_9BACI|nr:tail assembly chaperone [Halobacillus karajensis]CDQ22569.1 Phage protein [Halobacillus karajensis]CDQ26051.1 Phage protein [Halobacillus karajensis]